MLGQANHFLITILVGLNGVRSASVEKDEEFSTSWNPQSALRSADRSRAFVLDLALVRAIDSLDTYMMLAARKPRIIGDDFAKKMDGTKRSVKNRLEVFEEFLPNLSPWHKSALDVSIEWRNKRVHSLSNDRISSSTFNLLKSHANHLHQNYGGLSIDEFLSHFSTGSSPTFKEAAAVIRLTHEAVEHYDAALLTKADIDAYVKALLLNFITSEENTPNKVIRKTWDSEKKREKVLRILRMIGVTENSSSNGIVVSEDLIEDLVNLDHSQVQSYLKK